MASPQAATSNSAFQFASQNAGRTGAQPTSDELNAIASRAQTFTAATGTVIGVLRGDELVCCGRAGTVGPEIGATMSRKSIAGAALTEKKGVRCEDTDADGRADGTESRQWGVRSMVAVPVRENNQSIGVVVAMSPSPAAFTEIHVAILKTLADQLKDLRAKARIQEEVPAQATVADYQPAIPEPQVVHEVRVVRVAPPVISGTSTISETATKAKPTELILDLSEIEAPTSSPQPAIEAKPQSAPVIQMEPAAPAKGPSRPSETKGQDTVAALTLGPVPVSSAAPKPQTPLPEAKPTRQPNAPVASKGETKLPVVPAPVSETKATFSGKVQAKSVAQSADAALVKASIQPVRLDIAPAKTTGTISSPPSRPMTASISSPGFTPMIAPPKVAIPTAPPPRKERKDEVLPAAANPLVLDQPMPRRVTRPSLDRSELRGFETVANDVHSDKNKLVVPIAVTAILALIFAGWMLRGSLVRPSHAATTQVMASTAVPAQQPASTPGVPPEGTATPGTTTALAAAPATLSEAAKPAQEPESVAQEESAPAPVVVAKSTPKALAPVITASTSVPGFAPAPIEPPRIGIGTASSIPVIAAPVGAMVVAKHSTGATAAEVSSRVNPTYPMAARMMHAQGTVVLSVEVLKDGRVGNVRFVSGNSVFKDSAIAAVKQWRYKAAMLDGSPIDTTTQVELKFLPQ